MTEPTNGETKIKRVLFDQVSLIIAIIGAVLAVMAWVQNPATANKEQIEYLKGEIVKNQALSDQLTKTQQNDLHTIEGKLEAQQAILLELQKQGVKLETILNERIPKK